jgi:hypothetical protein
VNGNGTDIRRVIQRHFDRQVDHSRSAPWTADSLGSRLLPHETYDAIDELSDPSGASTDIITTREHPRDPTSPPQAGRFRPLRRRSTTGLGASHAIRRAKSPVMPSVASRLGEAASRSTLRRNVAMDMASRPPVALEQPPSRLTVGSPI